MNRMITRIGRLRREQYSEVTATRFGTTAPKKNEAAKRNAASSPTDVANVPASVSTPSNAVQMRMMLRRPRRSANGDTA